MRKYCLLIYDEYRQWLIFETSKGSFKIDFTSNIWISLFKTNYHCVTPHYIDNTSTLKKHILSFIKLEHQCTTNIISSYITRTINEYNIENTTFSITTWGAEIHLGDEEVSSMLVAKLEERLLHKFYYTHYRFQTKTMIIIFIARIINSQNLKFLS